MQCPGCGLYHPARYEQCVSCGRKLSGSAQAVAEPELEEYEDEAEEPAQAEAEDEEDSRSKRRASRSTKTGGKKKLPLGMITIGIGILLASAGGTYFFLSRPPESERLLVEGQKMLANGQFAFAEKKLEEARAIKPNDPKILLSLARAYVGTDQVERAWSCVSEAQQSGAGVMSDPQLTSDLAKYYVQRNQYSRAAELLRPLAQENLPHKKTELADLDALWGDDSFNKGNTVQALKCWEEVKTLGEGSRFNEADTRLATIYQKMSNEMMAKDDIEEALKCLNNLNTIAPSPASYEKAADLYAKQNKLDLAIDQMRKAIKSGNGSRDLNRKLAGFLSKRGKELLDKGDAETGYAYLQQAQGYDSSMKVPTVALRGININIDNLSGTIRSTGEAWNPGPNQVSYLAVKSELFDTGNSQTVWSKEQRVVDEFVAPLQARETRQFDISGPIAVGQPGLELRVYLDGRLYKTYPIGGPADPGTATGNQPAQPVTTRPVEVRQQPVPPIPVAPTQAVPNQSPDPNPNPGISPEERTLRDLE